MVRSVTKKRETQQWLSYKSSHHLLFRFFWICPAIVLISSLKVWRSFFIPESDRQMQSNITINYHYSFASENSFGARVNLRLLCCCYFFFVWGIQVVTVHILRSCHIFYVMNRQKSFQHFHFCLRCPGSLASVVMYLFQNLFRSASYH